MYVHTHTHVCVCLYISTCHTCHDMCGGQRTPSAVGSSLFPSSMGVLGIKLRLLRVGGKHLYALYFLLCTLGAGLF